MKKLLVFLSLFVLHLKAINCQSFDISKLGVKDIESGFTNIDPFRIILLEQGFKFTQKEEIIDSTTRRLEGWSLVINNNEIIRVAIELNYYAESKSIDITVNKEFQEYATFLLNDIKKNFPEKKLLPAYQPVAGGVEQKGYDIYYYRKDSKIEIQYSSNENYYHFYFYWNYNILKL